MGSEMCIRDSPWWGPPQAGLSHDYADLSGDGYGYLLECGQHTTGLFGAAVPWESGAAHKAEMLKFPRGAAFIGITRDRGHGRVGIDARGRAVPAYPITDEADAAMIRQSLVEMARIQEAAGADEIQALSRRSLSWRRGEDFEAYAETLANASLAPREMAVFSAHQMGSCRMGNDAATSVAGPWGQLHDTGGVWIGDASAFPTPSGTNPMLTTMALARRTAHAIAAAL